MKIWWHHNRKDDEEIRALSRKIRFKWNNINLFIRCRKANNDWDHLIWLLPSIYLFFYFNGIDFIRCIINMYRIKGLCRAGSQSEGSKKYRIHALQNGHIQIYYDSNIQAANKFEFSNLKLEHLMLTIVKRKENNTIFHQMGWQVGSRIFGVWVDFNVISITAKRCAWNHSINASFLIGSYKSFIFANHYGCSHEHSFERASYVKDG